MRSFARAPQAITSTMVLATSDRKCEFVHEAIVKVLAI
jgi:hypothetical protein